MIDPRRLWMSAFGFALLLITARLFLGSFADFAGAQDLSYFDESQYLNAGITVGVTHLSPQWAPPYCIWLKTLFHLSGDPTVAYHLSAYILAFALPALWYLLCIALGFAPWWALASALAWLVSAANLETLRVGAFAACIVLGGLIASRIARRPAISWWLAIAALWIAASVRLELIPAAVIVLGVGAWQMRSAIWIVAALVPNIALDLLFGWPFGGGRSGAAFQQHLAGNILEWHQLPFENWIHYEDVIKQYYALPSSALDFAMHEPLAFLHHVGSNAWRLVSQSILHALTPATQLWLVSPLAVAIIAGLVLKLRRPRGALVIGPSSVTLMACAAMVLVSCLVIYPREHYLPLLLCSLLLAFAPTEEGNGVLAAAAMLILSVVVACAPSYPASKSNSPRPEQETVEALRARAFAQPLRLFDDSGVLQVYLHDARRFGPRDFQPPFDAFLRDRQINAVVISPNLPKDPLLRADESWHRFESAPETFGFACEAIGHTDRRLCLRN